PFVGHTGYYFLGYYITDKSLGEITPQFFHFPATIASNLIFALGNAVIPFIIPLLYVAITLLFYKFLKFFITSDTLSVIIALSIWVSSSATLYWSRSFNSESFVLVFLLLL